MKIPDFYEGRWKNIQCRKDYENSKEKLDYLRKEYELWALWIDKFYSGEYGIFKIGGDAPRYAVEDYMDFCYWGKNYKKNYSKRDHFANHKVRAEYIIKLLTKLFNNVENYVMRPRAEDYDNDEGYSLDFQEMKEKMQSDRTYKQKWFKAAYDANDYIETILNKPQINNRIYQKMQILPRKRSKSKNIQSRKRSKSKNLRPRKRSKSKTKRNRY